MSSKRFKKLPEKTSELQASSIENLISTIKSAIGDLKNVKQIIRVNGMVNSASNFTDQPKVINGCSDLLVEVFGDRGKHTRVALGMNSLPMNIAVEIDLILEVENN